MNETSNNFSYQNIDLDFWMRARWPLGMFKYFLNTANVNVTEPEFRKKEL